MNNIFKTKEQYTAFRAKWRQLYAEGFHKREDVAQECTYSGKVVGYHRVSPLHIGYHFIFNLALGRDAKVILPKYKDNYPASDKLYRASHNISGPISVLLGDILTADEQAAFLEHAKIQYKSLFERTTV